MIDDKCSRHQWFEGWFGFQWCRSQACNFIKKETLAQVFSCEFYEIFNNTLFTEHLWWLLLMSDRVLNTLLNPQRKLYFFTLWNITKFYQKLRNHVTFQSFVNQQFLTKLENQTSKPFSYLSEGTLNTNNYALKFVIVLRRNCWL